jgi:hypothetical protein
MQIDSADAAHIEKIRKMLSSRERRRTLALRFYTALTIGFLILLFEVFSLYQGWERRNKSGNAAGMKLAFELGIAIGASFGLMIISLLNGFRSALKSDRSNRLLISYYDALKASNRTQTTQI